MAKSASNVFSFVCLLKGKRLHTYNHRPQVIYKRRVKEIEPEQKHPHKNHSSSTTNDHQDSTGNEQVSG